MAININSTSYKDARGSAIVEFAIALPILAIIFMGGVEFGRAFYEYNILAKSVRNAARYVSDRPIAISGAIDNSTLTKAKNIAVFGNVAGTGNPILRGFTTSQVNIPAGTAVSPSKIYVTVTANYPYSSLFQMVLPNVTFRPKVTMISVGRITYPSSGGS